MTKLIPSSLSKPDDNVESGNHSMARSVRSGNSGALSYLGHYSKLLVNRVSKLVYLYRFVYR